MQTADIDAWRFDEEVNNDEVEGAGKSLSAHWIREGLKFALSMD